MKPSSLVAPLIVGLFVLTLASFFASVLLVVHGPLLATAAPSFSGLGYSVLGICAAGALALSIPADALAERRLPDPGGAANLARAIRAACAWSVGMVGAALLALIGEWALLGAPLAALGVMALQFPRRPRSPAP